MRFQKIILLCYVWIVISIIILHLLNILGNPTASHLCDQLRRLPVLLIKQIIISPLTCTLYIKARALSNVFVNV